ncbi:MAG: hypothetical protein OXF06_09440 [Bacteroidetes bacterium]|nr:hypothetical protein [Bacteroidota bacterium]
MFRVVLLTGLIVTVAACSETVDTRIPLDNPYSLYGIINPKADTHAVRVFEITNNITVIRPDPLDATVMTTQLSNAKTLTWRDSVIQLENGNYRHVFWSVFQASVAETYHLTVKRSDGAQSEAMTTVPPPIALDVLEPDTLRLRQAIMPLKVMGTPPALPRIDVEYTLVGYDEAGANPVFKSVTFNYAGLEIPDTDGSLLNIDLREDYLKIYDVFDEDSQVSPNIIDLREILVTVHVGDHQWVSPVGFFDENFLVEPGSFSNVENGFGFFGSGYSESISFRPPRILIQRAGFQVQ